jgi:PPOX class probable FMN-dependent enzyme
MQYGIINEIKAMKIENTSQLRKVYGYPSVRAKDKILKELEAHSKYFINNSPFVVISTVDNNGNMDASPRGGAMGFVKINNNRELLIPDAKGNNRVDSLINIIETERVGLLFFIPGIDETLRVNGSASVSISEDILNKFNSDTKQPISCIVVSVEEVFLHCAKAFMRSQLWNNETHVSPKDFPSMSKMMKDQLKTNTEAESRKDMIERYSKDL